uniref:Uncharacterized protein n=1 Tax=Steinernema glaseri TaxID=37863 RepID=A0A1I7ZZE6_9BILA
MRFILWQLIAITRVTSYCPSTVIRVLTRGKEGLSQVEKSQKESNTWIRFHSGKGILHILEFPFLKSLSVASPGHAAAVVLSRGSLSSPAESRHAEHSHTRPESPFPFTSNVAYKFHVNPAHFPSACIGANIYDRIFINDLLFIFCCVRRADQKSMMFSRRRDTWADEQLVLLPAETPLPLPDHSKPIRTFLSLRAKIQTSQNSRFHATVCLAIIIPVVLESAEPLPHQPLSVVVSYHCKINDNAFPIESSPTHRRATRTPTASAPIIAGPMMKRAIFRNAPTDALYLEQKKITMKPPRLWSHIRLQDPPSGIDSVAVCCYRIKETSYSQQNLKTSSETVADKTISRVVVPGDVRLANSNFLLLAHSGCIHNIDVFRTELTLELSCFTASGTRRGLSWAAQLFEVTGKASGKCEALHGHRSLGFPEIQSKQIISLNETTVRLCKSQTV